MNVKEERKVEGSIRMMEGEAGNIKKIKKNKNLKLDSNRFDG